MSKRVNSIEKFKKFFAEHYKDEVFEILETYPDKRSLLVDYNLLETFNQELAYFLMENPENIINVAQIAIKRIDSLAKDADLNIRFENVPNTIPFKMLGSKHIGSLVVLEDVVITEVKKPKPIMDTAAFECRSCLKLIEVEQPYVDNVLEPSICGDCGGKSFRVLQEFSKFEERQVLTIGVEGTSKKLPLIIYGDYCSYDNYNIGNHLSVTGVLKTHKIKDGFDYYFDCLNIVQLTSDVDITESESSGRSSPEYKIWQKTIIDNDQVCACCGGHKHLHAHHIFGYKNNPSYRLAPENGIALCKWCHGKYHSYYVNDANPKTLIEFIKRFGVK